MKRHAIQNRLQIIWSKKWMLKTKDFVQPSTRGKVLDGLMARLLEKNQEQVIS